ncbi:hypothetical protein [Paraprevotella xylaniphila]|uniref:hypothetical protein n=1 Tax=Paraprevotella xylaniphila TaxID=454155 RepID=UPI001032A6B2|nr:hypothetical protein [Paraprevotella xylaniphila]
MTTTDNDEKTIRNGVGWCVRILAGMRLGYHVQGLAEKIAYSYLYEGFKMSCNDIGYIEWQSNWMNSQIVEDNRTDEANKVAIQIMEELRL